MNSSELIRLAEGILILTGIAGVVYAVFKSQTTKATIQSQKELIETLTAQISELRTLHMENEKAIAKLSGQLEVYKEIPLKEIGESLKQLSETQKRILAQLKG
jgi:uncharacterized protein HemX